jgi:hypothetical protein
MNKIKIDKPKRRIPLPQKPPKIEPDKKKYKRKNNKKLIRQLTEGGETD